MHYYFQHLLLFPSLFIGVNKMYVIFEMRTFMYHVLNDNDEILFSALSWKTCQDYIDDNSR